MIGAIPNPIVAASDWPVEYRLDGSMRPITTTIVVNSKANRASTHQDGQDRRVLQHPQQEAHRVHDASGHVHGPQAEPLERPQREQHHGHLDQPAEPRPIPTSSAPPPARSIFRPIKLHTAFDPDPARRTTRRTSRTSGTPDSAPTAPSQP